MEPNAAPTSIQIRLELRHSAHVSAERRSFLSHQMGAFIDAIRMYTIYGKESGISWTVSFSSIGSLDTVMFTGIAADVM